MDRTEQNRTTTTPSYIISRGDRIFSSQESHLLFKLRAENLHFSTVERVYRKYGVWLDLQLLWRRNKLKLVY